MVEKVKAWCDRHQLLRTGDKILIACSGGPDSLALTEILLELEPAYHLQLAVGHVDHMFRGAASQADADFVREFCAARGLLYFETRADVPAYAKEQGLSPEDAARRVRYAFLRQAATKFGAVKIATGHHADDQAETVLLHLLRGAGSSGIGGIRPLNGDIIRPFLSVSRLEIERYCVMRELKPRFDSTNALPDYLRNRVRLQLLPELMRAYNPAVKASLCRSAELVGAEHDFLRQSAQAASKALCHPCGAGLELERRGVNALHLAVKRELFRLAVEKMRGDLKEIRFFHIEQLINLAAAGQVGAVLELPGKLVIQCRYEALRFLYPADEPARQHVSPIALALPGGTKASSFGVRVELKILNAYQKPRGKHEVICDLEKLRLPIYLRSRQAGDRFQPSGMQGSKKLKDFFIDCKIEREKRDRVPLFCDQNEIFWIGGHRQNQASKVTERTNKFLLVTMIDDVGERARL